MTSDLRGSELGVQAFSDSPDGFFDDTGDDDFIVPSQYEITSFGADLEVEVLVNRLQREDLFIPKFQRAYVWTIKEASRFIESLILGLPVPAIFLWKEPTSRRSLVIDGQQRLKTLQFFFEEKFDPDPESDTNRIFKLTGVQERFRDKTFSTLDDASQRNLKEAIIHAIIVKQDTPEEEQSDDVPSSVYYIFERLNTSGRKLTPQQIRVAIYHGQFIETIRQLNDNAKWREIVGPKNKSLKDQELILRFFALRHIRDKYTRPMNEFLNKFCRIAIRTIKNDVGILNQLVDEFNIVIDTIHAALGPKAFRRDGPINAAILDSIMVGIAEALRSGGSLEGDIVRFRYEELLKDDKYKAAVSRSTADNTQVDNRITAAIELFSRA